MPNQAIPDSVRVFLASNIASIEELEVLLHLQAHPDRWWAHEEIYDVILSNLDSILNRLEKFATVSLVEKDTSQPPRYRYAPKTEELRKVIEETAALYRIRPVNVIRTIFAARVDPAQSFADAFRLRKT
jgi:hypothetical protein